MYCLLRRIHMHMGLLSWWIILFLGIGGLTSTVCGSRQKRPKPNVQVQVLNFTVPPNFTDKQVADLMWKTLAVPFTQPPAEVVLKRDNDNNLTFWYSSVNEICNVTVLE